jgi:excinuclease UvrABC ATPase subunit
VSEGLPGHASSQVPSSENSIEEFEEVVETLGGDVAVMDAVMPLVVVDQKPDGRTPRSILAT